MRFLFILSFCFVSTSLLAQQTTPGIVAGNAVDAANNKAIAGATVSLQRISDSVFTRNMITGKDGDFSFESLPFGYYRLQFTMTGYGSQVIDSIHLRAERSDFNLNDVKLTTSKVLLSTVTVYAEKPLIESKDGKIIFNTGESALSNGASTTELLKQTPLVSVDNDGKVLLKGKEVKVLIDEKPVELDAKQLQDLLESMPGSMIEKIEVMTTPPPQYANERGGVINIVTRKGKVGFSARLNLSYGTRGEAAVSGNLSYRKNKIALNVSAGYGYGEYRSNSYGRRQNIYTDSVSYFNSDANSHSDTRRPNARLSFDYERNKQNSFNFTALFNANKANSASFTEYANINNAQVLYKLSERNNHSNTESYTPNFSVTYTRKGKDPREVFKLIGGLNLNSNDVTKDYYQQYLNPDHSFTGFDSTQQQLTAVRSNTGTIRLNYDKPLRGNKLFLNMGGNLNRLNSHNSLNSYNWKKPDNVFILNGAQSNDLRFHQTVYALRLALRYDIVTDFYVNAGVQVEHTGTAFAIPGNSNDFSNHYWTALPFANILKKWKNEVSINLVYKRTIQRPGINELNPSIDNSDPYNLRFGNPYLSPWFADNFDLVLGKWNKAFYLNFSVGYNSLQHIYSSIRTLQPDGKTNTTWQNISGRTEYEASAWGGYTAGKKVKLNLSVGYTYHVYGWYEKQVRYFRDGGSLVSTFNGSYQFSDVMNANLNLTYNRFSNPQGTISNNLSMNLGIQRKFFAKKFIVSFNIIDPFRQQQNRSYTYAGNFTQESFSTTHTRNFRLALSYVFSKKNKKAVKPAAKKK